MMSFSQKIIITLCSLILILVLGLVLFEKYTSQPPVVQVVNIIKKNDPNIELAKAYKDVVLEAKSALVYDITNKKILFQLNPNTVRPLASLTKVVTALVGRTVLPSSEPITIIEKNRTEERDFNLKSNETWAMRDLVQYFLISSSNDGAQGMCDHIDTVLKKESNCVALLNRYVQNQGLSSMSFVNPTGLDNKDDSASNFGSAYDMAKLMAIAHTSYPGLFSITAQKEAIFKTKNFTYKAINTDKVLDQIQGFLIGKTGYTDTAGGNLAIIYSPRIDKKIAIIILGSSQEGRFNDMLMLVDHTNQYLKTN